MNIVTLIGRLSKDPELRVGNTSQKSVAKFTVAVNRVGKDKGADFITCVAFGTTADTICKYMTKGSQIAITGRITTGNYTAKDGKKVFTTDVSVDRFEFVGSKGDSSADPVREDVQQEIPMGFSSLDEDIPF